MAEVLNASSTRTIAVDIAHDNSRRSFDEDTEPCAFHAAVRPYQAFQVRSLNGAIGTCRLTIWPPRPTVRQTHVRHPGQLGSLMS
jgi:hypothetical protein